MKSNIFCDYLRNQRELITEKMKKKLVYSTAVGALAVAMGVMVACDSEFKQETIVFDDPAYAPDTTYINPVFKPVLADPSIVRTGDGMFYAYGTEDTWNDGVHHIVAILKSDNLVDWQWVGDVFTDETKPKWGTTDAGVWAPQIVQSPNDGRYYLYYSLSTWGDPNPGIGVAVADSPEGPFEDLGKILRSNDQNINVKNSIDPFFTWTKRGNRNTYYMFWGSFNGIYVIQMQDEKTVMPGAVPQRIAWGTGGVSGFEGVYIYKHGDYYYFFGSSGTCCEGADSQYHVTVARSSNITGPYVNEKGESILTDGVYGKPFLDGDPALGFTGPGHNAEIFTDDRGRDFILYHAVDIVSGEGDGTLAPGSTATRRPLMMDEVTWVDGWPVVNADTELEGKPSNIEKISPYFSTAK